jgi:vacuolar protein sorting-associated protein 26
LFLSPYDLTPTYKDIHNKFSVRYFLNLVLVDEEDRRYFKQQEITLYRKDENAPQQPPQPSQPPMQQPQPAAVAPALEEQPAQQQLAVEVPQQLQQEPAAAAPAAPLQQQQMQEQEPLSFGDEPLLVPTEVKAVAADGS